jgi:hypothetical protein
VIYFGFNPRPAVVAPLDPYTLYRGGDAIGHVTSVNVDLAGIFEEHLLRVETSKTIEKGEVLRFRHAICIVVDLGQFQGQLPDKAGLIDVRCRVVSGF